MLRLETITRKNWRKAVFLTTDPARACPLDEQWVTSTAFSMVQAAYEPEWECRLILDGEEPVGFVFFGIWSKKNSPLLCRYMIDVAKQGRGYGQAALPMVVAEMRRRYGPGPIYLTLEKENRRAAHIYEKYGFVATGEADEGEEIYRLDAPDTRG